MRQDVIKQQLRAMKQHGWDAILACSPENFAYVAGFMSPTQPLMRWRHAMALVTADGNCSLLVVDMEASTVRAKAPQTDIVVWKEFSFDCMEVLASLLRRHGLASSKIALETDYLPADDFGKLIKLLPAASLVPAQVVLARMRQIKTPEEVAIMRKLARIADQSINEAFAAVREGDSEMDIASALTRGIYTHGAEYFKLMIVATGERSVFPNVGPTTRRLRRGDVCRVEVFPMIDGYHVGVCRTGVVGEASPDAERIWANLVACKRLLLDVMAPGARTRWIYEVYLKKLTELDLPPISFIGHGMGLHLHEDPYLGPTADQPLEAGMVLAFEPLVFETGFNFGMQIKDVVLINDSGCELLSDFTNTDRLIVVS
ncbi:MAG TPA: Xaa-Pro peptidase family protein [Xanthobacteraceae bacterium]|jgi:Xaa-Pro aminopeptidase